MSKRNKKLSVSNIENHNGQSEKQSRKEILETEWEGNTGNRVGRKYWKQNRVGRKYWKQSGKEILETEWEGNTGNRCTTKKRELVSECDDHNYAKGPSGTEQKPEHDTHKIKVGSQDTSPEMQQGKHNASNRYVFRQQNFSLGDRVASQRKIL
ncbi:hypothetical protein PoB_004766900 [Plakobranchus ocellatus]|uniref:Uncharacterized protein n=1 Tax=Plakobranchus ocellatus TaxID=259542 RepID=A0AAV4BS30_9GAST|nr:hypothetical protein PoB_004766900 [Plakobranchus ocellatus]